jgi:hypothetical protein
VRHRHLGFDIGEADLTSLPASDTVPTPTAILSTSLGKYQLLWRVVGFTFTHQESTLKLRTIVLGSYLDCTGCSRILHLQGLPNCEYDPAHPFTVEHSCDSTWNPAGRRLDISATNAMLSSRAISLRKRLGEYTIPNTIGAWILHALAHVNGVAEWWPKEPVAGVESTGSTQVLKA